jgi:hypothetical protein
LKNSKTNQRRCSGIMLRRSNRRWMLRLYFG